MAFILKSPAFGEGEDIPRIYTGEGKDISPPLSWTGTPEGTKELALIADDPDAPTPEPWIHWVIYRIPKDATELPEGVPSLEVLQTPAGATQGTNSWGRSGYGGPMPPPGHGIHRYYFKLYALDTNLTLKPGATKKRVLKAMDGHILGQTQILGKYQR